MWSGDGLRSSAVLAALRTILVFGCGLLAGRRRRGHAHDVSQRSRQILFGEAIISIVWVAFIVFLILGTPGGQSRKGIGVVH